ncbi:OmpA family protein [Myxococcota bacterium]|nr:OmpA family protein [Myxococcota bacterium]
MACLLSVACVTQGTHDQVVSDRDQIHREKKALDKRVELLTVSNRNLDAERAAIADRCEDLRQRNVVLDSDLGKLRKSADLLSSHLRDKEERLSEVTQEIRDLRGTYQGLVQDLEEEVAAGQIEIEQLREGIRLNVAQQILFGSGSTQLNAKGRDVLTRVAEQLAETRALIEVQGHTDSVPIRRRLAERYPTNWELAGARASIVVRLLAEQGVDPELLRATSYGPYRPIASNETAEGRTRNRRIEIRLEPLAGQPEESAPASPVGS